MTPRLAADARKAQLVDIALRHFAVGGFNGTSTEAIAAEAGVSQPYVFRLYGTKRALFVECCALACSRVREAFTAAAEGAPAEERLARMGQAYRDLVADEHLLRFMHQMYAAAVDPEIRVAARERYAALVALVRELSGADDEAIFDFFARGMLINVLVALELEV